jgi:2-methylcitrate dehydratase PrpD
VRAVIKFGATGSYGLCAVNRCASKLEITMDHAQTSGPGPVINALSAYMSAARTRLLPAEVAEHAKHHLLDTLASMISGSELPPGQAAERYIRAHGGKGAATIAGIALTAAPSDAALANGVMAHADETDDSHNASRSHPGCALVPAALAVGEELGVDGACFLRAVTLGYDVGTRAVVAIFGPGAALSYESSLSTHSIAGTFCAAAAAACVAGLDARQMRWVLDYTAQQSSGIRAWQRDTDHIEKAFVLGGMPARNGVTSALVVRSGWNGVDDIFSGADNFFKAYAPKAQPERLVEDLGERYEITQTDIKRWTVGSPIQGPLDAVEVIRSKRPFEVDQVLRMTVRLAPTVAAVVDNREVPDICLQHMIAVMLLDKTVSFHAAHDKPRMRDPAVLRQRAKVNLVRDEDLSKLMPVRVTIVEIELTDGTRLSERVSAVRGTPRNPMSRAEVIDKARDLTTPILGREKSERLIETVYAIDTLTDIRCLRSLLHR